MKTARIAVGLLLFVIGTGDLQDYLRHEPRLQHEQMKAEEIFLGQIWLIGSPIMIVFGLALIMWPLIRKLASDAK